MGILEEVGVGPHRVEAGLLLRTAILHSSLLYTAEAWSNLSLKEIKRLEQVDLHLLKLLLGGHSKSSNIFYHLETGTLMIRHILTINRMMFHQHILTRKEDETIKKIYMKQQTEYVKGDWYQLLLEDFKFVGKDMDEEAIKQTPKETYRIKVKKMVSKAAFKMYTENQNCLSKIRNLKYEQLCLQEYLKSDMFSTDERKLLVRLRSKCHNSKANFKQLHKNQTNCVLGCTENEDQEHVFIKCKEIKTKHNIPYKYLFETKVKQKQAIRVFLKIDLERQQDIEALPPGEDTARTHAVRSSS